MAAPVQPNRGYSFSSFQTSSPTSPLPGAQVDTELDRTNASVGQIINHIAGVIRDDGTLAGGIVGPDQLAGDLFDGVVLAGAQQAEASATTAQTSAIQADQSKAQAQGFATQAQAAVSLTTAAANTAQDAALSADAAQAQAQAFSTQSQTSANLAQTSANSAATSAADALLSRDKARAWASDLSGPIDDGFYSARFYAIATLGYDPAPPGGPAFFANLVGFSPFGTVSATNVQAAIQELDSEKAPNVHAHSAADITTGIFDVGRLPVAPSGSFNSLQVVRADDLRLINARTPLAHTHLISDVTGLQATLDLKANLVSPSFGGTPTVAGETIYHTGNLPLSVLAVTNGSNTFAGQQFFPAGTTANASVRVPHGVAPTTPSNGDIWTTTADFFVRLNGTTVTFARTSHTHTIAQVTNLQTSLNAKADIANSVARTGGATGAADIPAGTTAQQPAHAAGRLRWNTDIGRAEISNGTTWSPVGGGGGGFRGNNGLIGTAASGDALRVHAQNLTADTTVAANENAIVVGPYSVDTGRTLSVASGGVLVIA